MTTGLDDREFSSRDVRLAAGLSPRQQNDWDERGVLPHQREGDEGWRRYTARELFVLMVCTEIRQKYGTPTQQLKWLQEVMLDREANHLGAALKLMATLGVGVWLCTDLEETFVLDSELEFQDMWTNAHFGAHHERPLLFLPVNHLVNRLLSLLPEQVQLKAHGRGYEIMRAVDSVNKVRSEGETMVLTAVRNESLDSVTADLAGGEVTTVRTVQHHDVSATVEDLLAAAPYSQILITQVDDSTVKIRQEITSKPRSAR